MRPREAMDNHDTRRQLLQIYQAALRAVAGDRVVVDWLRRHPLQGEWAVLAMGKAAGAMMEGARKGIGVREALVITKAEHGGKAYAGERWVEGGHPLPDARSLAAGEALLEFLEQLPPHRPLLVLLSGGASALVEVLPEEMTADQLAEVNRYLLGAGFAIDTINRVRQRLSLIKGGRLLPLLRGRRCVQLLIADVPDDDPAVIGSGPLIPAVEATLPKLPAWITQLCQSNRPVASSGQACESHVIANNQLAREAAATQAMAMAWPVYRHQVSYQGTVEEVAKACCAELMDGPAGLYIWGGEASVVLPKEPGRGGRNQHLALLAAQALAGREDVLLLAAATDGSDGPTSDAGGLVDGQSIQRGEEAGFSAELALARANAGAFLEGSGDLISTGPTGTNVMDLVLALKW